MKNPERITANEAQKIAREVLHTYNMKRRNELEDLLNSLIIDAAKKGKYTFEVVKNFTIDYATYESVIEDLIARGFHIMDDTEVNEFGNSIDKIDLKISWFTTDKKKSKSK